MDTINKIFTEEGYCKVDGHDVTIKVKYIYSPNMPHEDTVQFYKTSNCCSYLQDGKCNMGNACEIYKKAKDVRSN